MAGKPFKVGRFAHTLRVRLMREHVGVDVDALYEEDLMANTPREPDYKQEPWDPDTEQEIGTEGVTKVKGSSQNHAVSNLANTVHVGAKDSKASSP
jgi:phospholipase D1/2